MQRSIELKLHRSVIAIVALFVSILQGLSAVAQAPTPEQIEAFRNLPPDQQQAILEAMVQLGSAAPAGAVSTTAPPTGTEPGAVPQLTVPPGVDTRERTPSGELRLVPDDTLLVEILPLQWAGQERVLTLSGPQQDGSAATPQAAETPPAGALTPRPGEAAPVVRDEAETADLERLMDTFRRGNPYRVSRSGTLDLPGLAPIPVAGLTAIEATKRLTVEKLLQD